MTVHHTPEHRNSEDALLYRLTNADVDAPCFVCGRSLTHPYIRWMGSDGDIKMHPECTLHLAVRLVRDVHEVETTYGLATTTPDGRSNPSQRRAGE